MTRPCPTGGSKGMLGPFRQMVWSKLISRNSAEAESAREPSYHHRQLETLIPAYWPHGFAGRSLGDLRSPLQG